MRVNGVIISGLLVCFSVGKYNIHNSIKVSKKVSRRFNSDYSMIPGNVNNPGKKDILHH